jgi:nitrile hydratase beta subunit
MNGIHDLGGMDGFTLPKRDPQEPLFHHQWERLVFGSSLVMKSPWFIDESRFGVESIPPDLYLSTPYYARWLYRNEKLLIKYGMVTAAELADPDSVAATPEDNSTRSEDMSQLLNSMVSEPDSADVAASFKVGDRVVVKNEHPAGHTRAPRYARGHVGTIKRDQGVHIFPDTNAMGLGTKPQHCYSVMFRAQELWGSRANVKDHVYIDLFDDYLDLAR